MAKSKEKVVSAAKDNNAPTIRKAAPPLDTNSVNIDVTFTMGIGNLTAFLKRKGDKKIVAKGFLNTSGRITFNNVQKGDLIEIDGACAGKAHVEIDMKTKLPTPKDYTGDIIDGFIVA